MGRITKVTGSFMGTRFEVKPTPINFRKLEESRREMLRGWVKDNYPETFEKLDDDDTKLEELSGEDLDNIERWVEDVEFRSKYLKFMALNSMDFAKEPNETIWKSDDLEYSTIQESWDFFVNRRSVS